MIPIAIPSRPAIQLGWIAFVVMSVFALQAPSPDSAPALDAQVRGVVLHADGKTPAVGAQIVLEPLFDPLDSRGLPGRPANGVPFPVAWSNRVRTATTDADGRFTIGPASQGLFRVTAQLSELLVAERTDIRLTESITSELTLRLPSVGSLAIRFKDPSANSANELRVTVFPHRWIDVFDPLSKATHDTDEPPRVNASQSDDGTFRVEQLPPGIYGVTVAGSALPARPQSWRPWGPRGVGYVVGRVEVRAGKVASPTFELRPPELGRLTLNVTIDGVVVPLEVHLQSRDPFFFRPDHRVQLLPTEQMEIWPGPYDAFVRRRGLSEAYALTDPIDVQPGLETKIAIDVQRFEGRVKFLAANAGESMSKRGVAFVRVGNSLFDWPAVVATTDEEGFARVRLPPGDYVASHMGNGANAGIDGPIVRWTSKGPMPSVVKVFRYPDARR